MNVTDFKPQTTTVVNTRNGSFKLHIGTVTSVITGHYYDYSRDELCLFSGKLIRGQFTFIKSYGLRGTNSTSLENIKKKLLSS